MQRKHTSTPAGNAIGGTAAATQFALSDPEMNRRHLLSDPLLGAVEDLDEAIAILLTAAAALGNPNTPETYGVEPIVEALDIVSVRIRNSRKAASDTASQILHGEIGGAA